jgi:(-)-germacrene D synthase
MIYCLSSAPLQNWQVSDKQRVVELKGEVARLFEDCKDVVERMNLVDVVQRLGIDHHFKEQIDTALKNIQGAEFNSSDLHEVSLRFRLLRQHGLWVPAGDRSLTYSLVLYHATT